MLKSFAHCKQYETIMILPYLSILTLLSTYYLTYHLLPTYHLLLSWLSLLTFIHELFCINNYYMNNKYNHYTISIIVSAFIGIQISVIGISVKSYIGATLKNDTEKEQC